MQYLANLKRNTLSASKTSLKTPMVSSGTLGPGYVGHGLCPELSLTPLTKNLL